MNEYRSTGNAGSGQKIFTIEKGVLLIRRTMILALAILLAACQPSQSDRRSSAEAASKVSDQTASPPIKGTDNVTDNNSSHAALVDIQPPSPGQVISFIYNNKGDGSSAYEVENGSWAHYWYGHSYVVDNTHYFTGFVYQTPDKYGSVEQEESPNPGTKATISQATFVTANPGAEKPWDFVGAEPSIGEFGGSERGNAIDENQRPQTHLTPAGHYIVAVPTWSLATGARQKASEIFVRSQDKRWKHIGTIATGSDNSAACAADVDSEGQPPCVESSGMLTFQPQSRGDFPVIRVDMAGSAINTPGKMRRLDAGDANEYRYDAEKSLYRIIER